MNTNYLPWLRNHIRQIALHLAIIGSFVLYCVFIAVPLFNLINPDSTQTQIIELPEETNGIVYYIDTIFQDDVFFDITGWAFIENQDSLDSKIYVVLKSDSDTRVFNTKMMERKDVTKAFNLLNVNLDYAGFIARISKENLHNGRYSLGIYIQLGTVSALQYTDYALVKSSGMLTVTLQSSSIQLIPLPAESNDLIYSVESIAESEIKSKIVSAKVIDIQATTSLPAQATKGSYIYCVLKSDKDTYVFDTRLQKRKVSPATTNKDKEITDNLTFTARLIKSDINEGSYKLGILIKNDLSQSLVYTDKDIVVKGTDN